MGSDERADITHLYKHQEGKQTAQISAARRVSRDKGHSCSPSPSGSEEERIAVETASRYGSKPNTYSSPVAEDVSVEVKIEDEGARMGADAQLSILVKNLSSQPRRTTLHSQVAVMYYTGVVKDTIKKEQISVELQPNEGDCS